MRRIIDLSYPISPVMPVFPGDPFVNFRQAASMADGGYNVTEITIGSHTGTHVDVPHHCIHNSTSVSDISLESLVGWAEVLDMGETAPGSQISSADLDRFESRIEEGSRLILKTGWGKRWNDTNFFTQFPGLSEGAALWLVNRKIRLLAIEQPSVNLTNHLAVHKQLLSAGIVLIESLANLDQITQNRVYLTALPLKIVGGDGSPMRVIAIEGIDNLTD